MPAAWADRASATYLRTHCPHGISHHLGDRRTTCSTRGRYQCRPLPSSILGLPASNRPGNVYDTQDLVVASNDTNIPNAFKRPSYGTLPEVITAKRDCIAIISEKSRRILPITAVKLS